MIDYPLDYPYLSFLLSVAILLLILPVFHYLVKVRDLPPLLGYTLLLLGASGVLGAYGRWASVESRDPSLDHTIRIILVAVRLALIAALVLDAVWLIRQRRQEVA